MPVHPASSSVALVSEEETRLAALYETALLDAPPSETFDRLTRIVRQLLGAPVALVSLVDADRQFFPSSDGLPEPWRSARETPLSHSVCQYVVRDRRPLVVRDARELPLLRDNGATREMDVVAYCGVPLALPDGHVLGALCAIDGTPRDWTADEVATLGELAELCMAEIRLRMLEAARARTAGWLRRRHAILTQLTDGAPLGAVLGRIAEQVEAEIAGVRCAITRLAAGDTDEAGDELPAAAREAAWPPQRGAPFTPQRWMLAVRGAHHRPVATLDVHPAPPRLPSADERRLLAEAAELTRLAFDRARDAERLARQDEALQRARTHEAVARVAGLIAHEFNNLLGAVLGGAAELRPSVDALPDASAPALLRTLEEAARAAATLTDRLLAAVQLRRLEPRLVDGAWLQAAVARLQTRTAGRVVPTAVALPPGVAVHVDPEAMREVVQVLAAHLAEHATAAGVRVTLETATVAAAVETVDRRPVPWGSYVRLSLDAQGPQLVPALLRDAFDFLHGPSGTDARPDGAARALALPVVAGLVRQMGGHLTIEGAGSGGCVISLWFTALDAAPGAATPPEASGGGDVSVAAAANGPEASTTGAAPLAPLVLLVDDEPTIRRVLRRALERRGFRVREAENGALGLAAFLEQPADVVAVVSDWRMPGLDGRTLRDRVRATRPELPVLLMSGYGEHSEVEAGSERDRVLLKPFAIEELLVRLRQLGVAA